MNDVLTEVRFWAQVIGDAKRTVICSPEMESRCNGYVDARGLGGLITVMASPGCPDGRLYIIDEQSLTAKWLRGLPSAQHPSLCICDECDAEVAS